MFPFRIKWLFFWNSQLLQANSRCFKSVHFDSPYDNDDLFAVWDVFSGYGKGIFHDKLKMTKSIFSQFKSIQHVDASFFIVTSGSTSVGSILALYCYYGKKSTDTYSAFGDCVYGMDWYDLPVNLQKYFTLTIANAQVPIYYHGLGIAYLNLESYTKASLLHKLN